MEWLPIDTAPKDGTEVILHFPKYKRPQLGRYTIRETYEHGKLDDRYEGWSGSWTAYDMGKGPEPTHWMPLPAKPPAA
jgi:hypothetical protein